MENILVAIKPILETIIFVSIAYCLVPLLQKQSQYIDKKQEEITANIKDNFVREKVNASIDLIQAIVLETAQTFVDPLKASGDFTNEKAIEAKNMAIEKVKLLLSTEGMDFLSDLYGDATEWIAVQIEAFIKEQKN